METTMKILNRSNKVFLTLILFLMGLIESQAGLSRNITPKFLDSDLTAENVLKSIHSGTFPISGLQFNVAWKEGIIDIPTLETRINDLEEKTYVTFSNSRMFIDGKWYVPTERSAPVSELRLYELPFYGTAAMDTAPLATLYLAGTNIQPDTLRQIAAQGLTSFLEAQEASPQVNTAESQSVPDLKQVDDSQKGIEEQVAPVGGDEHLSSTPQQPKHKGRRKKTNAWQRR
jgi:hypothetical protein